MSRRTTLLWALAASLALGCSEPPPPPAAIDSSGLLAWATARHLGIDIDPSQLVATVDGHDVTLGDVALCIELTPVKTPQECLDWVIETYAVEGAAEAVDEVAPVVQDARESALAAAFIRDRVLRDISEASISEAQIEQFRTDPTTRLYIDLPELRRSAHLRIWPAEADQAALDAVVDQIVEETDWEDVSTFRDLQQIAARYLTEANSRGVHLEAENIPWTGPFIDGVTHGGIAVMDPDFTRALFAIPEVGQESPPTASSFGVHIITLLQIQPAASLPEEEARALAIAEIVQRDRSRALDQLIAELAAHHDVRWISENAGYLGSRYDDLLQQHGEALREGVNPDETGP